MIKVILREANGITKLKDKINLYMSKYPNTKIISISVIKETEFLYYAYLLIDEKHG